MRPLTSSMAAVACLSLAACATPAAIRDLASEQAGVLNSYGTGLKAVAEQQSRLNGDNEARLRNLAALRVHNDSYVAQRLTGFSVAEDKTATDIYGLLSARSATDVLNSSVAIGALTPPPAAPQATYDGAEVTALVTALRATAKRPSRKAQAKALFTYAQGVKTSYAASLAAASADANKAAVVGKFTDLKVEQALSAAISQVQ